MKSLISAPLAAAVITFAASSAGATTLLVTYSDTSGGHASWEQPSNPTPVSFSIGSSTEVAVSDLTGNLGVSSPITYNSARAVGGFDFVFGPQLYSGSESAPVFSIGTFTPLFNDANGGNGTITYSAVIPEPPIWGLMLAGFGALAALRLIPRRLAAG
jgi:hypothetical protein